MMWFDRVNKLLDLSKPRVVVFTMIAIWCAGCDTIHGVSRTLPLDTIPSRDAVEQALRITPEVTEVTTKEILAWKSWSLSRGTINNDAFTQFSCRDQIHAFAVVEPKEDHKAGKMLRVYSVWMNHPPNSDELAKTRSLIDRICATLHQRLPAVPSSSSADDIIFGIDGH